MARTSVWRSALVAAALGIAGCGSEQITTPGACPALCPTGNVQLADTLLPAADTADTSVRGFVTVRESAVLFASSQDSLKSVVLIRFLPVSPDTFTKPGDTTKITAASPPDSALLLLQVGQRDTVAKQLSLVFYRLPATFDTTMTYAQAQPFFADSQLVMADTLPDTLQSGAVTVHLPVSLVAPPQDSGVIALGVKVVASVPTAIGIASGNLGTLAPRLSYFVHGAAPNDTLKRSLTVEPAFATFVQTPDPAQTPPGVLAAGGLPAARSWMHLDLPKVVVDSNSIVRATLILNTASQVVGFPHDSFYVQVRPLLRDFGAKSVLFPDSTFAGHALVHVGQTGTVEVDIAPILRLWGTTLGDTLPKVLVVRVFGEGAVIGEADFKGRSAGAANGAPQLRVTYVKKYEFGVP